MFFYVVICGLLLISAAAAEDIAIIDYVGDFDTAGQHIYQMLNGQQYDVSYSHVYYYMPWRNPSLLIVFTAGGEYELNQEQVFQIVEHLRGSGSLMLFGDGAHWLSLYWCGTDIATSVVYPISGLTGSGALEGFYSLCEEINYNSISACPSSAVEQR